MKTNGRKYREYVLVYVDNVLSKSDKPESTMAVISSNITHLWISRDTQKSHTIIRLRGLKSPCLKIQEIRLYCVPDKALSSDQP